MGYSVKPQHAEFNADGNSEGYVGVATPTLFPIGAVVFVSNRGASSKRCIVTEQTASTIRLLAVADKGALAGLQSAQYGGGSDMSSYTQAAHGCVDMEDQVVPGRTSP